MYYHIKLLYSTGSGELKINLSEEELIERFIEPYLTGDTIVINGTTVDPTSLERIQITKSEETLTKIIDRIKYQDSQNRSIYSFLNPSPEWRAADMVTDITDKFINKPPGSKKKKAIHKKSEQPVQVKSLKKVFVVHGHDTELKNDVELFLKSINLEPIVLHRQLDEGLTLIEKFEKHSDVNYAIILLTPDDIAYSISEKDKKEEDKKIELRSRQNVIFEFGFFVGRISRKNVCCIYKEGITLPSDLNGLVYKKVNKTVEEIGLPLMKELKNAGLKIKFE